MTHDNKGNLLIPDPIYRARVKWKNNRKIKLTLNEAKRITTMLQDFRNSKAGEHYVFGIDEIVRMEDTIDRQLFGGRVYRKGELVKL